jgi:hypothetical protein
LEEYAIRIRFYLGAHHVACEERDIYQGRVLGDVKNCESRDEKKERRC